MVEFDKQIKLRRAFSVDGNKIFAMLKYVHEEIKLLQ